MADLNTDVRYIKGIGERRAKALGKLGIATPAGPDLLLPRAYDDRSALRRIADLVPGETAGVAAMVASPAHHLPHPQGAGSGEAPGGGRHRHPGCDLFNQAWLKTACTRERPISSMAGRRAPSSGIRWPILWWSRRGGGRSPAASCPSIPLPPESAS